jgi:hypothetical protein
MLLTLERLQSLLTELSALVQFIVAILGLIAILLPFFQRLSFYHDDTTYILPTYITTFLHKTLIQLGMPQLMMYIRPQEYYDNLSQKLKGKKKRENEKIYIKNVSNRSNYPIVESELAKTSKAADICLIDSGMKLDHESVHVSGLVNTGNSCFLNSVLQLILYICIVC